MLFGMGKKSFEQVEAETAIDKENLQKAFLDALDEIGLTKENASFESNATKRAIDNVMERVRAGTFFDQGMTIDAQDHAMSILQTLLPLMVRGEEGGIRLFYDRLNDHNRHAVISDMVSTMMALYALVEEVRGVAERDSGNWAKAPMPKAH